MTEIAAWGRARASVNAGGLPHRYAAFKVRCTKNESEQMMRSKLIWSTAAVAVTGVLATGVFAQGDVVRARQEAMKAMGTQADAGAAILKGKAPYDKAKVEEMFRVFREKSAASASLFPPGSNGRDSKATDAVWSDPKGFAAAFARFDAVVAENAAKAGTANGFKAAFVAVGGECRACHQSFKTR